MFPSVRRASPCWRSSERRPVDDHQGPGQGSPLSTVPVNQFAVHGACRPDIGHVEPKMIGQDTHEVPVRRKAVLIVQQDGRPFRPFGGRADRVKERKARDEFHVVGVERDMARRVAALDLPQPGGAHQDVAQCPPPEDMELAPAKRCGPGQGVAHQAGKPAATRSEAILNALDPPGISVLHSPPQGVADIANAFPKSHSAISAAGIGADAAGSNDSTLRPFRLVQA